MTKNSSNAAADDRLADATGLGLHGIIVTELLRQRPNRPADHAAENHAIFALGQAMGEAPHTVLQKLVDTAVELTKADSAGISVLEDDGGKRVFRWRATAGAFFPFVQSTLPRDFSPCGVVLDRNATQLMYDPVRFYPYIADLRPHVSEVLLVPFHRGGVPIGTVWVAAHSPDKHFDAEDERVVTSLSKFASAALRVTTSIEELAATNRTLEAEAAERGRAERSREVLSSELQRQSRVYDTILSATDDFAYIFDRQGRFLFANRRLLEVWGKTLDEVIGQTCHDLGYPTWHADMHMREIRHVVEAKRPVRGEVPFTGGSGIAGVYDYILTPVLDAAGEVDVITGTSRDVTDRKRAEEERERLLAELRAQRSLLADVIERAPAFIAILRGPQHVFEIANQQYYEIVGARDLIGKAVREALPEVEGQGFFELLDNVYRTGETFTGSELPVRLRRKGDGSLDQRYMSLVYQPLREADGSISGIFVHGVDVTDLVVATRLAQRNAGELEALIESMPHAVYFGNEHGITRCNRLGLQMLGASSLADLEARIGELGVQFRVSYREEPDRLVEPEHLPFARALRGEPASLDTWVTKIDGGGRVCVRGTAAPVFDGDRIVGAVAVNTDITDSVRGEEAIKDARDAAEAANRAKDRFLAVLSHELRTPLTPVAMAATAMEMDPRLPFEFREDLAMVRRNIDLETRLIDDLLDLSRVTSGKLRLNPQPTDVHRLIRHVLETVGPELHEKQLIVERQFSATHDRVQADPARLQQTLWNLLKNAAKFTPPGGRVSVATRNDADQLLIEVGDSGKGIAADVLPRIFEPFEQGTADVTQRYGGMGLGLAIAKAVVDLHGGTIRAASEGEGRGATFTVALPLAATVLPTTRTPEEEPDVRHLRPVRVLLVEDHADTAKVLVRLLRLDGSEVQWAGTVAAALELASSEAFDVVVSDLGLPDGSGHDLIRRLSRERPVVGIAMSGYGMEDDIRQSREAGFVEHLVKPVSLPQLREAIRRVASTRLE